MDIADASLLPVGPLPVSNTTGTPIIPPPRPPSSSSTIALLKTAIHILPPSISTSATLPSTTSSNTTIPTSASNLTTTSSFSPTIQSAVSNTPAIFEPASTSISSLAMSRSPPIAATTSTSAFHSASESSTTSTSLKIFQSAGFQSVNPDFTSTRLSTSVFTTISDGHSVTVTTLVPITKTASTSTTAITQDTQHSASKSHSSLIVSAIVGSLVGVFAFGLGTFLFLRRWRQHQRTLHTKITPLIDQVEEKASINLIPPNPRIQHLARLKNQVPVVVNESESALPGSHDSTQLESRHSVHPEHRNTIMDDDDHDVRLQVAEMRLTMGRMMDHVHRLEAQIGQDRNESSESISSSDGRPPPTYQSS
ncbi:hypothetical protein D9757_011793 [Collybiopsis confluens]|uniref:Transmembrane protein n=1 Tax=Collybiopsis confluens TaxID=2823264 RepID=A0A8H5H0F9_9AGAR|nr:hypothetical protein D9757_011793 [Collybiopsis confluens]